MAALFERLHHALQTGVDPGELFHFLQCGAELRGDALLLFIQRPVGRIRVLLQLADVAQHHAFLLQLRVFARTSARRVDFFALEAPQVRHAELFLFRAIQLLQLTLDAFPAPEMAAHFSPVLLQSGEIIQRLQLRFARKKLLLLVLAVNVA